MLKNRRQFLLESAAVGLAFTSLRNASSRRHNRKDGNIFLQDTIAVRQDTVRQDEYGVFIITGPEHKPEEIKQANTEIPPVTYLPPTDRWLNLPITVKALAKEEGELKVVMLGDSIINDTYRSQWYDLFQAMFPKCKITALAIVRGNTGCWWYKEQGRVKKYVYPQKPDLLVIGGISQNNDTDSIKKVIRQVRSEKPCDVLLMTESFGEDNPNDDLQWSYDIPLTPNNYRRRLMDLSIQTRSGFLDMYAAWGRYIRESKKELVWFKRDVVHANIRGEQVIGHILADHFSPPLPKG